MEQRFCVSKRLFDTFDENLRIFIEQEEDCKIIVHAKNQFMLPAALTTISDEAFMGLPAVEITLSDKVTGIGKNAFANCENLVLINLPDDVQIGAGAFTGCDQLTILCSEGSDGHIYAKANDIPYILR